MHPSVQGGALYASVVFFRLPEFARRSVVEQARLRAQLEAVVAVTTAEIAAASRLLLEAPEGLAVVVLGEPQAALALAERALHAGAAGLPLAAGLDHGAVQVREEGGESRVLGDAIAVAAQAAGFATAGALLASRAFRDALASAAPGTEVRLGDPATFSDAGLRAHQFYRVDPSAPVRRSRRYALAGVLLAAGLIGATLGARVAVVGHDAVLQRLEAGYGKALRAGSDRLRGWTRKVGL